MLIRRESGPDADVIRAITTAAFARPGQQAQALPEVRLVDELRESTAWLPVLSLVATGPDGEVIGHVVCTRGHVEQEPVVAARPGCAVAWPDDGGRVVP